MLLLLPVLLDVDLDGERGVDLVEDVELVVERVDRVRLRVRLPAQPAQPVRALHRYPAVPPTLGLAGCPDAV